MLDLFKELWQMMLVRKKFWLVPLIFTIVLLGALLFFTQGSVVAPFVYTLF